MTQYHLVYGQGVKPLVRVIPHDRWPDLWRWILPDGRMSSAPASLTCAKDSAADIAARMPQLDRQRFRWREVER